VYRASESRHRASRSAAKPTNVARLWLAGALAAACALIAAGCGSSSSSGTTTLKYYAGLDPGGTNVKAAKECSAQSNGRYTIELVPLANNADASRELLVRRLAAKDSDISLINMDTIWTTEFAAAGWLRKLTGAEKQQATAGVLSGALQSVQWKGDVYAVPLNTNAQLLWYRKDLVPTPPKTWAEMIADAKKLPAPAGDILEQGNRYEGYVVWFNNLVNSAGGHIVDQSGKPVLDQAAVQAAQIIKDVATSGRAAPSLSTDQEDQNRLAFEAGKGAFMLNWPFVYASARADSKISPVNKKVFDNMAWAPYPEVVAGQPSRVSIGGANIGISIYGRRPDLATQAAICMTRSKWQNQEAINEGLPPVLSAAYDDPTVRKAYPFAELLRQQLNNSITRPATPAYSDVTLAIQQTLHPPASLNPQSAIQTLGERLKTLADGGLY
jgi:multiple sugar transport system substrate-binding protein